jgi:tetratricopeptide (TPR) repeat protein
MNMKPINIEKKQIDLIRESMCVYTKCMQCKDLYRDGALCFGDIEEFVDDRGKSCLFKLKEMCHDLFRNSDSASYREKLYDMTVGYVFHQAMILRENLYQLEYYKPRCDIDSDELTIREKKIFLEMDFLVKKTEKKLKEGFKETKLLLKELVEQLKDLIKLYKENYLLPRFMFEQEKTLVMIYGKKNFDRLLNDMYKDGRRLLMFNAAHSYLESEYYELARNMFQKAACLDTENKLALFLFMYSSAFFFYYKNRFTKSYRYAENALSLEIDESDKAPYIDSLKKLRAEISREIKRSRAK